MALATLANKTCILWMHKCKTCVFKRCFGS